MHPIPEAKYGNAEAMIEQYPNREERHRVQGLPDIQLQLAQPDGGISTVVSQLLDISPGGAKFSLAEPLLLGDLVGLSLERSDGKVELSATARVCWIRPAEDNRWTAGCAFAPRLPDEALGVLFSRGLLERRRSPRHAASGEGLIQWELESAQSAARLCNASVGGFCLESEQRGKAAERLLLFVRLPGGKELTIAARSQWQMRSGDGYLIGCCFVDNGGYPKLLEFLEETGVRPRRQRLVARRLPLIGMCAVVLLYWLLTR
jgi:hypothetical protein